MQERMFPIGTNLTQGNLVLFHNTEPQNQVAGFMQLAHFFRVRWRHEWHGVDLGGECQRPETRRQDCADPTGGLPQQRDGPVQPKRPTVGG